MARNVLGGELASCSESPRTGYYRNGCCDTGPGDLGVHTVCARVTAEFLEFSRANGNDLSTPHPEPTHVGTLEWCDLAALQAHAVTD
jgi:uncharacterized protein (DUF2237 family)